jgi:TusA-related sulfurtransferase
LVHLRERAWVRYSRRSLLSDLFRDTKQRPFELFEVAPHVNGTWRAVFEKSTQREFQHLLVLARYRCPGPIAELMSALSALKPGETLQLLAFAESMDGERLNANVAERGYQVQQLVAFGGDTFGVKIGLRSPAVSA